MYYTHHNKAQIEMSYVSTLSQAFISIFDQKHYFSRKKILADYQSDNSYF